MCRPYLSGAREWKISNSQPATHTDTHASYACIHALFVPVHPEICTVCMQSWCEFLVERFCFCQWYACMHHHVQMRALWSTFIQMSRSCSEKIHLTKSCEGKGGNILFHMHVLRGRTVHACRFLPDDHILQSTNSICTDHIAFMCACPGPCRKSLTEKSIHNYMSTSV